MSKTTRSMRTPITESARELAIEKLQNEMNELAKKIQKLVDEKKHDNDVTETGPPMADSEDENGDCNATANVVCAFEVDQTQYEVEKIIKHRIGLCGQKEYFVKWVGYGAKFNEWVEGVELELCAAELIGEYESSPAKKGGHSTRKISK